MLYRPADRANPSRHAIGAWFSRLAGSVAGLVGRLLSREHTHTEIARLRALDDRMLADMGIERTEIGARLRAEGKAHRKS